MWNGTADALNARPPAISAIAAITRGSSVNDVPWRAVPMVSSDVLPVAPNSSARPYSRMLAPTAPVIRYFRPLSSERSRQTSRAHST